VTPGGCGATCVTSADEMAQLADGSEADIGLFTGGASSSTGLTSGEVRVLDALTTRSGRDVRDIARRSGLPVDDVRSILGVLQLSGVVDERQQGWIYVTRKS
jgi:DNA processing protein